MQRFRHEHFKEAVHGNLFTKYCLFINVYGVRHVETKQSEVEDMSKTNILSKRQRILEET